MREITVGAGAQQKGALHGVHGAEHRARAGERTEIVALNGAGAAVLDEPRRGMVGADQDVGETLVVAQHDVVPGFQLLDEIGLEQQRLGFCFGGDEHHRARVGDHPRDASRLALRRRIGGDALPDRSGLPDIEHLALGADHAIDAGPERSVAPEFLDRFRSAREARGVRRGLVAEGDVEGSGVRRELPLQRRLSPSFGFRRLARRIAFRRGGHEAYLGRGRGVGNTARRVNRSRGPGLDLAPEWR